MYLCYDPASLVALYNMVVVVIQGIDITDRCDIIKDKEKYQNMYGERKCIMLVPAEIAQNCIQTARKKAELSIPKMLLLSGMAGAFIALGAVAANVVSSTIENAALAKLLAGCVFPVGLIMVLIAGSELFTGNCLMFAAVLHREIRLCDMLKNWFFVYLGNFIGGFIVAALVAYSGQFGFFDCAVAVTTIKAAAAKTSLSIVEALLRGVLCNILVCIAVWMSFSGTTVTEKVAAVFMPVMVFVLAGFEHSVANMYYIPAGLFAMLNDTYAAAAAGIAGLDSLTIFGMLKNLFVVSVGNILGGAGIVALIYWFVYLKGTKRQS